MLDLQKISIPFKREFVTNTTVSRTGDSIEYVDIVECSRRGICLEARSVMYRGDQYDNKYEVGKLRHPYESLPTSFSGIAMKIFQGSINRYPCIELKASPAKILQGHNVFGFTSLAKGADEMFGALIETYPELWDMLDSSKATLDSIDVTFSARVQNEHQSLQVISALKNISNGHMRSSIKNEHETTAYFNKNSRHLDRKVYLKYFELKKQLNQFIALQKQGATQYDHLIDVMSDPMLINFARNLVRFEAGLKRRYLDKQGVPSLLSEAIIYQIQYEKNGDCLITDLWKKAFAPLMKAFEGGTMNIYDDKKIQEKIKAYYKTYTRSGNVSYSKADRVFRFYREIMAHGYSATKDSYSSSSTFYDKLNALLAVGFSKAQLQNLTGDNRDNVIPLMQVINVDFANQRPDWYQEPTSGHYANKYGFETDKVLRLYA